TVGTLISRSSSRASATISRVSRDVIVAFEYAAASSPRARAAGCSSSYRWRIATFRDLARLERRRHPIEHEPEADAVFGDQAGDTVEQARKARRDSTGRVLERRSVAPADERQ